MHAVYMRSVRSPRVPVGGLGRYKLKDIRSLGSRMDVLSQVHEEDKMEDDYEEDSFCVGESYVEEEEDEDEECEISHSYTVLILSGNVLTCALVFMVQIKKIHFFII